MNRPVFQIFDRDELVPDAETIKHQPKAFHSQGKTETGQMFYPPTSLRNRSSQRFPIREMEFFIVCRGSPKKGKDNFSEIVKNRSRNWKKGQPVNRDTQKD